MPNVLLHVNSTEISFNVGPFLSGRLGGDLARYQGNLMFKFSVITPQIHRIKENNPEKSWSKSKGRERRSVSYDIWTLTLQKPALLDNLI